jgi:hypothetical protein
MVGSSFITDTSTSLWAWVNEANQKLHGKLVEALGEEYVSSVSALSTIAGTSDYAVPSGFFKLYGVELTLGGLITPLQPFMRAERNDFRNANGSAYVARRYMDDSPRYALIGSNIRIYPVPQQVFTGSILYAPEATVLTAGTDTVNYPNGWERFIVLDAAIQALAKEESSVTALVAERAEVVAEIDLAKEQRDLANPKRVRDVTSFAGYLTW